MPESRVRHLIGRVWAITVVRHRIELRRRRDHPQLLAAVVLAATFGTLLVVGSLPLPVFEVIWPEPGAYHYGTLVGAESDRVLVLTREIAALGIVATVALGALGATTSDDWEEPPVEIVTAVPLPAAILGVLGDELLESSWFVAPAVAGGALAFTAGTGTVATFVGAATGGALMLATGLLAGTAIGVAIRASIRRSPRLYAARYGVSVVVLFVTFMGLAASRTAGTALAATPLGWYGDLLLVTTPDVGAVPARGALALLASLVLIPAAVGTVIVAGRSLWFAEAVLDDGTVSRSSRGRVGKVVDRLLERAVGRATAGAVRTVWRRMRRSPRAMVYVVLPLAFVGPVTAEVGTTAPGLLAPLVVFYAACAVGLGTTLNPLGNERVALPLVQTTPGGTDAVLRGHALAALLPGLPLVAAVAALVGLAAGYPSWALAGFVVTATLVTVAGSSLSLAAGTYLPNLEGPTEATLSPPELYAMFGYLAAMSLLSAPLFVGYGAGLGLSPLGTTATVAVTVLVGYGFGSRGHRYASNRLETFDDDGE